MEQNGQHISAPTERRRRHPTSELIIRGNLPQNVEKKRFRWLDPAGVRRGHEAQKVKRGNAEGETLTSGILAHRSGAIVTDAKSSWQSSFCAASDIRPSFPVPPVPAESSASWERRYYRISFPEECSRPVLPCRRAAAES